MADETKQEWVSLEEAAGELGTTRLNLLMHVKRGLAKGQDVDGAWLVSRESLEALKAKAASGETGQVCEPQCQAKSTCGGCR